MALSTTSSHGSNCATVESELKYQLSEAHYNQLLQHFGGSNSTTKEFSNHFFDTPSLDLRSKKIGLRIRIIDNEKALITLKHPSEKTEASKSCKHLIVRNEYEEALPYETALSIVQGNKKIHTLDDVLPIQVLKERIDAEKLDLIGPLGQIDTTRTVAPLDGGFRGELDHCVMFGKHFYELEVETKDSEKADETLKMLFSQLWIPYKPSTLSKLSRFLTELKHQNKA